MLNFRTLANLIQYEWRMLRRSPVWMIGLGATFFMAFGDGSGVDWPTANQSLDGFQLSCAVLMGVVAFLLAAGSMRRDVEGESAELLFCRPMPMPLYVAGKFLGVFLFSLGMVLVLLLFSVFRPYFSGRFETYDPRPFVLVLGLCVVPMLAYVCSLALAAMALIRQFVVALPLFLVYFFCAALFSIDGTESVNFIDFTMRLFGRDLVIDVPVRLTDFSFAHLLNPVAPELIWRAVVYLILALLLLLGTGWLLARRRSYSVGALLPWISGRGLNRLPKPLTD